MMTGTRHQTRGIVLPSVLLMVVALSLSTYYFSARLINDLEFIEAQQSAVARRIAADSGVAYAAALTNSEEWSRIIAQQDPQPFHQVVVASPHDEVYFSLVKPQTHRHGELHLGMIDLSSKLNLNDLRLESKQADKSRQRLMVLPGMTLQAADGILDWLDADHEPRQFGAERNFYQTQQPPRQPTNGPVTSLMELINVRGVDQTLLFGEDLNRDGWLDANENDGDLSWPPDDADGQLKRGLQDYLTVASGEATHRWDGEPKINLNRDELDELFDELATAFDEDTAIFLVGLRLAGPSNWKVANKQKSAQERLVEQLGTDKSAAEEQQSNTTVESTYRAGMDLSKKPSFRIRSLYDLFGTNVRLPGGKKRKLVSSPWTAKLQDMQQWLPKLQPQLTIAGAKGIHGRVNVNTAPAPILLGVPKLTEKHVQEIVAKREQRLVNQQSAEEPNTLWLLEEGILTWEELRQTGQYLTAKGDVHSFTVIAYDLTTGPLTRLAAILDATVYPTRILRRVDRPTFPATFRDQFLLVQP